MIRTNRILGHKEWAPGRKSDPVYDMNWRRDMVATDSAQEDDVPSQEQWDNFTKDVWTTLARMEAKIEAAPGAVLFSRFAAADGQQRNIPDFLIENLRQIVAVSQKYDARPAGPVVTADVDYGRIAGVVNDEADRRARDGDPNTGPRS